MSFELSAPPGEWIHPTYRVCEWYHDQEGSSLQQHTANGTTFCVPAPGYNRTRLGMGHTQSWVSEYPPEGCQISAKTFKEMRVLLREIGPNMAAGPSDPQTFWEVLEIFGGEWMWEGVGYGKGLTREGTGNTNRTDDMTWLVDGMENNTSTWFTEKNITTGNIR